MRPQSEYVKRRLEELAKTPRYGRRVLRPGPKKRKARA